MIRDGVDWRVAAAAEYAERRAASVKRRDNALARMARIQLTVAEANHEIAELDQGAKVFGLPLPEEASASPPEDGKARLIQAHLDLTRAVTASGSAPSPQFKEVALKLLENAYPNALKAAEVQEAVQHTLGRQFHWKTAGMTLYRLKTEGAVRREGQSWFYVTPEERARLIRQAELAQDPSEQGPDNPFEGVVL